MIHVAALTGEFGMSIPVVWAWCVAVFGEFAGAAGGTLATSIWQGAVIVCGLEIAIRMLPRISAAHRFAVWAAGFMVAVGLPLLPLVHFGTGAGAEAIAASGVTEGSGRALLQLDARWGLVIAGLWLAASSIRATDLLVHSMRLRRLWKSARPVDVGENLTAVLSGFCGGRTRICTTEMLDRPSVIGFCAPRILIPGWLLARLTAGELEQIVLHEAEHLRRRDDWTNLLQKLALVVFPLNPGLAWMEHRLCREREMACDEGVVRITNAPRAYAACLASLAERGLERRAEALSLGAWHRRSELVHRVHGILLRRQGLSRTAAGALLGIVGCALLAGSVEMARCPQLVAFATPRKSIALTPARQQQLSALLASENAASRMTLPPGFRAVPAKVMIPAPNRVPCPAKREGRRTTPARKPATGQQIARTDTTGDRLNAGTAQHAATEQQWVVLAAWEEVQTVSRANASTSGDALADYNTGGQTDEASLSAPQTSDRDAGHGKPPSQRSNGYAVTQLILKVVPANRDSKSTQPAAWVRGSWIVFQL